MKKKLSLNQIDFSLKTIDQRIAESMEYLDERRPIIGISTNHNHVDENRLTHTYCDSVSQAGGIPVVIPLSGDIDLLLATLRGCDALIVTGGGDIHSKWWGEQLSLKVGNIDHFKDYYDFSLLSSALYLNLPILAICRGMQALNVVLGGSLIQDVYSEVEGVLNHSQTATRYEVWHSVQITGGGRLPDILGREELMVNSFHHQAVGRLGECGKPAAVSSDGIIEAVDYYPEHNALGVQWHPEALAYEGTSRHLELFRALVTEATLYRKARELHRFQLVTLDSHVDTPSILVGNPCGDNALPQVDYSGMVVGGMDLYFMAAYVPQSATDPYPQALEMLQAVDEMVQSSEGKMVLVKDVSEVKAYKASGKKMVCKAVENGNVIEEDLSRLQQLSEQGVKYITLCHNGDNQICDSANRSQHTHGGLSPFGKEVVQEMNRLGIVVDVSHASDETIRDVLKCSKAPIIASHSSCRALCPHPRNLSDELMLQIAEKGGVIQICMYHGFLKDETASVLDFVNHIDYAVKVVGEDHVGIGTDFDGGGGVIGCRHSSDMLNVTIELLRKGYTRSQLQKIWGGNLLRIMN